LASRLIASEAGSAIALYVTSPAQATGAHASGAKLIRSVELICFALIVVNAVYLAASYMQGLTSRVVLGEGGADFDRLQSVSA